MDQIRNQIASGRLEPGETLPSVRQVAEDLQVNPMTVSKAYSLLERDGVLELVRGLGVRVKEPERKGNRRARAEAIKPLLKQVVATAFHLGLTHDEVLRLFQAMLEEAKHD
ncbi:MAG: GntR family transcriptional regulator [Acidobacteria bacterium]|nr:GntR family transcriptional regulator [Acidobacteriota bacterium]